MERETYSKVLVPLVLLALVFTPFSEVTSSPLDGDNTLERSFRTILQGDVVSATDTISGFETSDPLLDAHVTYIVGDGQSRWENGDVTFNGTSIANNVFNGDDGDFWGTLTFDVTALSPTDPSTTTIHNLQPGEEATPDCLVWAATIFSVTPPQPDFEVQAFFPLISR